MAIDRRTFALTLAAGAAIGSLARPAGAQTASRAYRVTGPHTGGRHGHPFAGFLGDLDQYGYVEEEYFLAGDATSYVPVGEHGSDGRWEVRSDRQAPYQTRLMVRRPRDPARFNGTVVVEWINVSVGWELATLGAVSRDIYRDGFALVTASCQIIGLDGFKSRPQGLKAWDPERYGSLSIPSDIYSYDIFSQAGRAVGPRRSRSTVDPLDGLEVRHVIGTGASQSAGKLRAYINAIQPRDQVFDALLSTLDFALGSGFDGAIMDISDPTNDGTRVMRTPTRIRTDLATPVMVVNSESECLSYLRMRQPDTDRFRFWEVAGASHGPTPSARYMRLLNRRDELDFDDGPIVGSDVLWQPTADAALMHLHRWLDGGAPPPGQQPIEVALADKPQIMRDALGNARGGVRLPELEVPVASYRGVADAGRSGLFGSTTPLPPDVLARLYPTKQSYVEKFTAAARQAEATGVIRPGRAGEYLAMAQSASIG